jgi:hypothetical protein
MALIASGTPLDEAVKDAQHPEMLGKVLCRLGRHRWQSKSTVEGVRYLTCARCGTDQGGDDTEPRPHLDDPRGNFGGMA